MCIRDRVCIALCMPSKPETITSSRSGQQFVLSRLRVADTSGALELTAWGRQSDMLSRVRMGDVLFIDQVRGTEWRCLPGLSTSYRSRIRVVCSLWQPCSAEITPQLRQWAAAKAGHLLEPPLVPSDDLTQLSLQQHQGEPDPVSLSELTSTKHTAMMVVSPVRVQSVTQPSIYTGCCCCQSELEVGAQQLLNCPNGCSPPAAEQVGRSGLPKFYRPGTLRVTEGREEVELRVDHAGWTKLWANIPASCYSSNPETQSIVDGLHAALLEGGSEEQFGVMVRVVVDTDDQGLVSRRKFYLDALVL
eukprot:TRINITY_DN27195_c0_g1_i1.p1 TRINITY_DN27195_c0_g1~~TRINITY_DN27195_c0_g1_i1.p1  ORF type:complete len:304 (+),score=66.15 TRINITY_DN27195_c0_g1_i1:152-1063(+)